MSEPVFTEHTFRINDDVYFVVNMAYVQGHPIIETKSLRLYYHSREPVSMNTKSPLAKSLMMNGTNSQFAVNLLNYLSRLANDFNLYDCYINNSNHADKANEIADYISHTNQLPSKRRPEELSNQVREDVPRTGNIARTTISRFEMKRELLDDSKHVISVELEKTRSARAPRVLRSLANLTHVPVYTYVAESGVISWKAKHVCHLAFLLERLVHNENYPEFNNQAALASLNATQRAEHTNLDVQTINENEYKRQVEKKRLYKQALAEERGAHAETKRMHQELLQRFDETQAQNARLIGEVAELKAINLDQTQTIDELYNMTFNAKASIEDMKEILKDKDKNIEAMSKAANHVIHEVGRLAVKDRKMDMSKDILVLYLSETKPATDRVRADKRETQLWIASYNGKDTNFKPPNIPDDHEDLFTIDSNRLDSFEYMIAQAGVRQYVRKVYQRSILIDENDLDGFIDACDNALNENNTITSIRTLDSIKQRIAARRNEERKTNSMKQRKRELLLTYPNLHIVVHGYRRVVYVKEVDEDGTESLVPVSTVEVDEAVRYVWYYRYGRGGNREERLTPTIIRASTFSNDDDPRIQYE